MNLRIDRSKTFQVFAVEEKGKLLDLRLWANAEKDPRYLLHLAKVKKLLPAVNGAILDLGDREAYLGWQDLEPERKLLGSNISDGLKVEERLLVQIRREESGDKADKATLRIAIPGAYGIYLPRESGVAISSKIKDPAVRARLESQVACREGDGVILRTLAAEAPIDAINKEIALMRAAFQFVKKEADHAKSLGVFCLDIDPEPAFFARWIKDADALVGNDSKDQRFADAWGVDFVLAENAVDPIWVDFSLLRERVVPLKGAAANILVEELETLTAIDVNRGGASKNSVAQVDQKAVKEAMRQLRLRNIGGMVVMDIIDKRNAQRTTRNVTKEKRHDSHSIRVYGPTAMGLIELVRTKRGASLLQLTGDPKKPTMDYALWRLELEIRKAPQSAAVRIQGSPELIQRLQASSQWKSWKIPADWKRIYWEMQDQQQEFLRILPSLRK